MVLLPINTMPETYVRTNLRFLSVAPDSMLNLEITTPDVEWSLGADSIYVSGVDYRLNEENPPTVQSIGISRSTLTIKTVSGISGQNERTDFEIALWIKARQTSLQGFASLSDGAAIDVAINGEPHMRWYSGKIDADWNN